VTMKNRLYLVIGGLLVAAVGGLMWWAVWPVFRPRPAEPVYEGLVSHRGGGRTALVDRLGKPSD
jgi:hypothetical protein